MIPKFQLSMVWHLILKVLCKKMRCAVESVPYVHVYVYSQIFDNFMLHMRSWKCIIFICAHLGEYHLWECRIDSDTFVNKYRLNSYILRRNSNKDWKKIAITIALRLHRTNSELCMGKKQIIIFRNFTYITILPIELKMSGEEKARI